ncbi:MAG: hypothetical protein QOJ34_3155 [Pseudonocardiales bacterium]|jgi:hypothetical protein|nr:hypothetical protein [Pseudonocardiales bacterium]
MTSREWNTAVGTGLLRLGVGAALLRWRKPLSQRLAGASADDTVVPMLFGYFGVRDMLVGLVTLASTRPSGDVRKAVRLQGHADATDALLVTAVMRSGRIPQRQGIGAIAVAGGSAVSEYVTALALKRA